MRKLDNLFVSCIRIRVEAGDVSCAERPVIVYNILFSVAGISVRQGRLCRRISRSARRLVVCGGLRLSWIANCRIDSACAGDVSGHVNANYIGGGPRFKPARVEEWSAYVCMSCHLELIRFELGFLSELDDDFFVHSRHPDAHGPSWRTSLLRVSFWS